MQPIQEEETALIDSDAAVTPEAEMGVHLPRPRYRTSSISQLHYQPAVQQQYSSVASAALASSSSSVAVVAKPQEYRRDCPPQSMRQAQLVPRYEKRQGFETKKPVHLQLDGSTVSSYRTR